MCVSDRDGAEPAPLTESRVSVSARPWANPLWEAGLLKEVRLEEVKLSAELKWARLKWVGRKQTETSWAEIAGEQAATSARKVLAWWVSVVGP